MHMGLDSAFFKQTHIHAYDRDDVEVSIDVVVAGEHKDIDPKRVAAVRETIVTMRHCWMIHDWLEKELDIEINGDIYIPVDVLKKLRSDIEAVLDDHGKAAELIPDDEYGEIYFFSLQDIHDELEKFDLTWKPYVSYVYSEW